MPKSKTPPAPAKLKDMKSDNGKGKVKDWSKNNGSKSYSKGAK